MARIAGVDLPREKRVEIGLTYIFGIGNTSATKILAATGINPDTRVKDLTEDEKMCIRDRGCCGRAGAPEWLPCSCRSRRGPAPVQSASAGRCV